MQSTITRIACELARTTDARRPVVGSTAGSVGRSRVMSAPQVKTSPSAVAATLTQIRRPP